MPAATCPYCAERLAGAPKTCPACGESLVDAPPPPTGSKAPMIIAIVVVVVFGGIAVVGILAALLMPALMKSKEKAMRTRCANNQRQLALAAIQYADDKRFFPHVRARQQLDGDVTTNDSTKVARTLLWFGYHDDPEGFICPSSTDVWVPITNPAVQSDLRRWFWEGGTNPAAAGQAPLFDAQPDPALDRTSELSYGWTRRALSGNARSSSALLADRARRDPSAPPRTDELHGNHLDGWNVTYVDGAANWIPDTGGEAWLAGTTDASKDAYLAIDPPK